MSLRAPGYGAPMANITGSAGTDIEAPLDAVWAVVQDVGQWAQWQSTLGQVSATAHDGEGRVSACEVDIDAKVTKISMRLECSYAPPSRMSFERVAGDLGSLEGTWRLEDLGGGRTRATYELEVDPGRVIGFLLNAERKDRLRALLVDARPAELKARVEG
ncbi:MAG: hypothetical protein QOI73_665 [Solirubrobacteraceae bacterium]|nr:hypothetical protein [Solirubrobacteraceae bacterium]